MSEERLGTREEPRPKHRPLGLLPWTEMLREAKSSPAGQIASFICREKAASDDLGIAPRPGSPTALLPGALDAGGPVMQVGAPAPPHDLSLPRGSPIEPPQSLVTPAAPFNSEKLDFHF